MKILHLNQFGSLRGGVEAYVRDVSQALDRAGHDCHLVYFTPDNGEKLIDKRTLVPLPRWPSPLSNGIHNLERTCSDLNPDVVFIHAVDHPGIVKWIAQRLPTVAYVHSYYPICPGSAQYLRRRERVCPRTAGLVCLINAQLERCCWGVNPVRHSLGLILVSAFRAAYEEVPIVIVGSRFMQGLLRRSWGAHKQIHILAPFLRHEEPLANAIPGEPGTVLWGGRLVLEKGVHHLIEALSMVRGDWRLIVAGDGEELQHCEELAKRLGVANRVSFTGWLTQQGMAMSLERSCCVAVPSLWPEPFGRLGPEALGCGRPVIAYNVGGICDWLVHDETGYLVSPGSIAEFSHFLKLLLESPYLRERMGRRAIEQSRLLWSADDHVTTLVGYFWQAALQPAK